jgi:hypothetical protein
MFKIFEFMAFLGLAINYAVMGSTDTFPAPAIFLPGPAPKF